MTGNPPIEQKDLPLGEVRVSPQNVRVTDAHEGLDELKASIAKFGVLQPVVVTRIPGATDVYDLIIGQRRLLACRQLGLATIPARILPPLSEDDKIAISLAENLQRRRLPFRDGVQAIGQLYDRHRNVSAVARILGVSDPTVRSYLTARDLPQDLQLMVEQKRISRVDAGRAWTASGGDRDKAVRIAQELPALSMKQKDRLVRLAEVTPGAQADDLLQRASAQPDEVEVVVVLPQTTYGKLAKAAADQNGDPETVARKAVMEWLDDNGYAG